MKRPRLPRALGAVFCCGSAILFSSLSFVHPFVSSGEYGRVMQRAADCTIPFVPDPTPLAQAEGHGLFRFASFQPAGAELYALYRPADLTSRRAVVRFDDAEAFDWLGNPDAVRMVTYEVETGAVTTASYSDGMSCTHISISTPTPEIQVELRATNVSTNQGLVGIAQTETKVSGLPTGVPGEGKQGGRADLTATVVRNGEPVGGAEVIVYTDPRGFPGRYGRTVAHEHFARGGSLVPSMRVGSLARGKEAKVATDRDGRALFSVTAGTRGGPEAVIVRLGPDRACTPGGATICGARSIIARDGRYVHFTEAAGASQRSSSGASRSPVASVQFPFMMVGYTPAHHHNHFLNEKKSAQIAASLRWVWASDSTRVRRNGGYLIVNDASLEYGGAFHVKTGAVCEKEYDIARGNGSHINHTSGVDLDIAPCYSTGPNGQSGVSGAACVESGSPYVKIDERVLAARVIGVNKGAILKHGPGIDSYPAHYHIRF
jgi:hypothetical protein